MCQPEELFDAAARGFGDLAFRVEGYALEEVFTRGVCIAECKVDLSEEIERGESGGCGGCGRRLEEGEGALSEGKCERGVGFDEVRRGFGEEGAR